MSTPLGDNYDDELVRMGVTGQLMYAPHGTVAPVGMAEWPEPFVDLGWISDEGITESVDESTEGFTPWQSTAEVREDVTSVLITWETTLWTTSFDTVALYFRKQEADMTRNDDGSIEFVDGNIPKKHRVFFGIDVIDDPYRRRIEIPNGGISERGGQEYRKGSLIGYPITIKGYLTAQGWSCKRKFLEGWDLPTAPVGG